VSAVGSLVQHIVLWYYLGVGISIIVLDTYAILVKYLAWENGGREKMTNQLCVLCVVKNCYLLIRIFPTANMRRSYAGIGICVDDWSFAIFGTGKFMITTTKKRLDV
jgi:hypothetical protein